jgi:GNAT superfamily N-acetyltransferase
MRRHRRGWMRCCWPGGVVRPGGWLLLALRPLDTVDYANAAEMKRLLCSQGLPRFGLGRQLAEAILDAARQAGYDSVLLDTLDDMEAARALYEIWASRTSRRTTTTPFPGRTTSRWKVFLSPEIAALLLT